MSAANRSTRKTAKRKPPKAAARTPAPSPTPHAAHHHDRIRVQGARVNNLADVSLELPKRRLSA